jgi:hypothetical protein
MPPRRSRSPIRSLRGTSTRTTDRRKGPGPARGGDAPCDGARRHLRRRERYRRRVRAVPGSTGRRALLLERRGSGHGWLSGAPEPGPGPGGAALAPLRGIARGDTRRGRRGRRGSRGERRGGCDDRRAHGRRSLRRPVVQRGFGRRTVAGAGARPGREQLPVGRGRGSVPCPRCLSVRHGRSAPARKFRLCDGVRPGQNARPETGSTRTADQTDQALFWADHAVAMWTRIFRQLSVSQDLSTVDNARYFAMLYLTGADAAIACFQDKQR